MKPKFLSMCETLLLPENLNAENPTQEIWPVFYKQRNGCFMAELFEISNECQTLSILTPELVLRFFKLHYWNPCEFSQQ